MKMIEPDIDHIREIFHYDPISGFLYWNYDRSSNAKKGSRAGSLTNSGYREVRVGNKQVLAHRVIWGIVYGEYPKEEIDHIDGNKDNNSLLNLRSVTKSQNQRNAGIRSDNKTGVSGVRWHAFHKKWAAQIKVDGKNLHLGYFEEFDKAVLARREAEIIHEYHPNHGKRKSYRRQP